MSEFVVRVAIKDIKKWKNPDLSRVIRKGEVVEKKEAEELSVSLYGTGSLETAFEDIATSVASTTNTETGTPIVLKDDGSA